MNIAHIVFFASLIYPVTYTMQHSFDDDNHIKSKGLIISKHKDVLVEAYGKTTNQIRMWATCLNKHETLHFSGYIYDIDADIVHYMIPNGKRITALWYALKDEYNQWDSIKRKSGEDS